MAPATSRRSLASGAVAALLGTAGVSAASPAPADIDADLIKLCAEFRGLQDAFCAIYDGSAAIRDDDEAKAAARPVLARQNSLLIALGDARAQSAVGIQARAETLAHYAGNWSHSFDHRDTVPGRLLDHLMRDAAALAIGQPAHGVQSSPDAELIALCAEFDILEREFLATDFGAEADTPAGDHADAEQERIQEAQTELADRICGMRIDTLDGARALARTMALNNLDLFRRASPDGCTNERLVGALVGGLIGWPDGTARA